MSGSFSKESYWTPELLEAYDATFGERIFWKCSAVFEALAKRWQPDPTVALWDWGCGPGTAARAFLHAFPQFPATSVHLTDKSALSEGYAERQIAGSRRGAPQVKYYLVASHVDNELDSSTRKEMFEAARCAEAVFRIEPGTPEMSRALVEQRKKLSDRFTWIAPCPHNSACGLEKYSGRDWCHFFATPPSEVFQDGFWNEFSRRLQIDLRSLPVSYLCGTAGTVKEKITGQRLLGRPRIYKGITKAVWCSKLGVEEKSHSHRKEKHLTDRLHQRDVFEMETYVLSS